MRIPLLAAVLVSQCLLAPLGSAAGQWSVPILLYHRFGPAPAEMTVPTATFEEHLATLRERGYTVIPLRRLVDAYYGRAPAPPPRSVVLVADDAHRSVLTDMLPLVKRYRVPVTLFVYPSAVSNASYAMTWEELRALRDTGLFDFQSHTYWHPNFKREKRKLPPAQYAKFVDEQLRKARSKIERELGGRTDLLAWPFGIWDDDLLQRAQAAGYTGAFTIARRPATAADSPLKLPRYLLTASDRGKAFLRLLDEGRLLAPAAASAAPRPAAPSRL